MKTRTTEEPSPTKEKLLDAAQRLMLAKGYPATTVNEICVAARLTKGSFFYYFESKEDLGRTVLDRYVASGYRGMQQAPFLKKSDPLERVYGYVDFMIEMSKNPKAPKGCLLGSFAQELSDTHPEIRSQCAKLFLEWAVAFRRDLDAAKSRYAPKTALDTRSLAEHFIAVLEGSLILAKAKREQGIIEKNLRHFKRYLKSLFGR